MTSRRLTYHRLTDAALDDFHELVQDDHVRRYLMDGQVLPRAWSEDRVRESTGLFARRGVGLWLARARETPDVVGFCGFLEMPSLRPEPQLVYALFKRFTARGYATEMAQAAIDEARRHPGFATIVASVDAVNVASVHVVEKLGFRQVTTQPGAFGDLLIFELDSSTPQNSERAR